MPAMLWALTSYYNPAHYARRLANYRRFRAALEVPLLTLELGFDGRFELTAGDADVLLQIGRGDVMWQKERLLNVGLGHLPRQASGVLGIDCDMIYAEAGWARRIERALATHTLVQAFSVVEHLGPSGAVLFAQPALAAQDDPAAALAQVTQRVAGSAAPGHAWAYRRDFIDRHGFFDRCIVGGGDTAMAGAACAALPAVIALHGMNAAQAAHYRRWGQPLARALGGSIGIVDERITHLWHGEFAARQARSRHALLTAHAFDPDTDLYLNACGTWSWKSPKPALHSAVVDYFAARLEDA